MTIAAIIPQGTHTRATALVHAWTASPECRAIPSHWPAEPGDHRGPSKRDAADYHNAAVDGRHPTALAIQAFFLEVPGDTNVRAIAKAFHDWIDDREAVAA
jgi:hypothetical protein